MWLLGFDGDVDLYEYVSPYVSAQQAHLRFERPFKVKFFADGGVANDYVGTIR
jgi:hypothetical protein